MSMYSDVLKELRVAREIIDNQLDGDGEHRPASSLCSCPPVCVNVACQTAKHMIYVSS
jgi:hypothetical protein